MVQQSEELVQLFMEYFEYRDGCLYWRKDPLRGNGRYIGKRAGCLNIATGYRQVCLYCRLWLEHRVIFAMHYNYLPELIDHRDRNKSNNLINNLRDVSKAINGINSKVSCKNTSGVRGVGWDRKAKKWVAYIRVEYKQINLGSFKNIEDATRARQKGERDYWSDT